jgi:tetratricopeptide (TPR) repeat protein
MTPTALRHPGDADMIWPLYASKLAHELIRPSDHADDAYAFAGDDIDTALLWVLAIKQHYGPGTEFLDVTHSVGVAAWFALHRMHAGEIQSVYGPPGPFNPETDSVGVHPLVHHLRFDEASAYFYVLDAAAGTGAGERKHGTLFDLALAPAAFSSSARIRAQQACLIYADPEVDGGDLSSLFVPGTPLRISWPLEGWPEASWLTNQIFPSARDDDWYARFVSIPLAPSLRKSKVQTVFDHPIAVTLYQPEGSGDAEDRALLEDLTDRFVVQRPALLYPKMLNTIARSEFDITSPLWPRFADATPLLLEGPMMTTLPPVNRLNLGLLPLNLADSAPTRDLISGGPAGEVSLRNVFIEVSALDATGWETFERDRPAVDIVRGMWLVRDGDRFFLTVYMNGVATDDYIIGPVEIVYEVGDLRSARFFVKGEAGRTPLADIPDVERWFAKALAFVRSLSPRWKLSPFAQSEVGIAEDRVSSLARLEWALGEVVSLRSLTGPISSYCVLRQWGSDEPFYGDVRLGSAVTEGAIRVQGEPYARVKPGELLAMVESELASRDQRPPPVAAGGIERPNPDGEHDELIGKAETSVRSLRERVSQDPALLPLLVDALNNLSAAYSQQGLAAEAVSAAEEAAGLVRTFDVGTAKLADQLINLGASYGDAGRAADAIRPLEEAVSIYRRCAERDPSVTANLAVALSNLGNNYSAIGQGAQALAVSEEAVRLDRELAVLDPAVRPALAAALGNLGGRYRDVGQLQDALASTGEAASGYRELVGVDQRFAPELAATLSNLSVCYQESHRDAEAVVAREEAVQLYRELAARYPALAAAFRSELYELGILYMEVGNRAHAIDMTEAAVSVYRELAAETGTSGPQLARALNNLGIRYSELGRAAEAVAPTEESARIRRQLAAEDQAMLPDLARSLDNLGNRYSEIGRHSDALAPAEEAVAIYRKLISSDASKAGSLAIALNNLSNRYNALDRLADAVESAEQAVAIFTDLAITDPSRLENLALMLHNLGDRYRRAGRADDIERVWQVTLDRFHDPRVRAFLISHRDN